LKQSNKSHNLKQDYENAAKRLNDLGIMINGSFVFGLDNDDKDVFKRTVDLGELKMQSQLLLSIF
jgi:radical SAM superfamily enzyme